jgi:uncharacterized membrane protein
MANGNLNDALVGNYTLDIGGVFSEAWQKTKGFKLKAWGAFIITYAIVILAMVGLMLLLGVKFGDKQNHLANFGIQLVIILIIYPLFAGAMMMAIHQVSGKPVSIAMLFGYFDQTPRLFLLYIVTTLMTIIGFVLLILPGIYLAIAYTMAMPLLIEKKMGIWEALETSRKALGKRWFTVFALFILMGILVAVSALPLGIGLIWTIPFSMLVMGVMYKTIFGVNP